MTANKILIVGGYGEVGRRLAALLEKAEPGRVIVAGRHPEQAREVPARAIDVDDPASIEQALEGVSVVVACVRQREPHLLRAAVRRGIAYTSIAPPWMPWPETEPLRAEAQRTGARVVLAAGLEPGISSVLVRAAADRLGAVDSVESGLLLSLGDSYGADSMSFIFEEVSEPYTITVNGHTRPMFAFERSKAVAFPEPIGSRRAYTMPFRDQLYYPATLGAKTATAYISLDPPWLARAVSVLLRLGLRRALRRGGARGTVHGWIDVLRRRYVERDMYALVVDVHGRGRMIRSTLVGRRQAVATAVGVYAITEALWSREVQTPGVWLAEQVIAPEQFFSRLATHGIVPLTEEISMRKNTFKSWILSVSVGHLVGIGGAMAVAQGLASQGVSLAHAGGTFTLTFSLLLGAAAGAAVGAAEWPILRRGFENVSVEKWLGLSALGGALVGLLTSAVAAGSPYDVSSIPATLCAASGFGLVAGGLIGGTQAWALHRLPRVAVRWCVANSAGWAIGSLLVVAGTLGAVLGVDVSEFTAGVTIASLVAMCVVIAWTTGYYSTNKVEL